MGLFGRGGRRIISSRTLTKPSTEKAVLVAVENKKTEKRQLGSGGRGKERPECGAAVVFGKNYRGRRISVPECDRRIQRRAGKGDCAPIEEEMKKGEKGHKQGGTN